VNVPLSILDLSPISAGSAAATALRDTVDLAQHAERWGYRRFWVAEHHFVAVASSSPAVLIGQIAAATNTIRVGAAAVQFGHTTAVATAESFGMLDAYHPGRIDLGVGRSGQKRTEAQRAQEANPRAPREWREVDGVVVPPPFDVSAQMRSERLRAQTSVLHQPEAVAPDFADQVGAIVALLDGRYAVNGFDVPLVPGAHSGLVPWVFGSSTGQSPQVAAALGLPFVASYHITPGSALERSTPTGRRSSRRRRCPNPMWSRRPTWWSPTTARPRATWRRATATGCTRSGPAGERRPTRIPTTAPR
jgi:alkanesulfonate monooxygenase SsuD/methylene tetrahydromethanopterin reductase-like flavin-dependent oxidoreductase (luciferase family)